MISFFFNTISGKIKNNNINIKKLKSRGIGLLIIYTKIQRVSTKRIRLLSEYESLAKNLERLFITATLSNSKPKLEIHSVTKLWLLDCKILQQNLKTTKSKDSKHKISRLALHTHIKG